jgi:hypothetical protein
MQTRRIFLESLVAAGSLPAVLHVAKAQTYPAKPVRIICGFRQEASMTSMRV